MLAGLYQDKDGNKQAHRYVFDLPWRAGSFPWPMRVLPKGLVVGDQGSHRREPQGEVSHKDLSGDFPGQIFGVFRVLRPMWGRLDHRLAIPGPTGVKNRWSNRNW